MAKFLLIFCSVLAVLFAIEMLNPVQEAVIHPFTAVLADVSTAVILPFDDTVIAQGPYTSRRNHWVCGVDRGWLQRR